MRSVRSSLQQARRLGQRAQRRTGSARARRAGGWRATSSSRRRCYAISVFSRSNAATWRSGDEHLAAQPADAVGASSCPASVFDPGVLDDRRQVDLADVVGQSTLRGSKLNAARSAASRLVPHRQQVVDLVDRLALGVQAVQLDVLERPLDLWRLRLELAPTGRPACRAAAAPAAPSRRGRSPSWPASSCPCTRPRPGNCHSGTTIGWPSAS